MTVAIPTQQLAATATAAASAANRPPAAATSGAHVAEAPDESVREMTVAIAAGDTAALARLYRGWFDFILQEAHRCTGRDEHFCLDAVQEAMLRLIKRLPPLNNEAALTAWMKTTVRSA